MFGFSGVLGSISIAVINAVGEKYFDKHNTLIFEIALINYLLLFVFIVVLGLMGKLNK